MLPPLSAHDPEGQVTADGGSTWWWVLLQVGLTGLPAAQTLIMEMPLSLHDTMPNTCGVGQFCQLPQVDYQLDLATG